MDLKFFLTVFVATLSASLALWFWALPATSEGTIAPIVALGGIVVVVVTATAIFRSVWSVASGNRARRR